jgi:hypothetical protein
MRFRCQLKLAVPSHKNLWGFEQLRPHRRSARTIKCSIKIAESSPEGRAQFRHCDRSVFIDIRSEEVDREGLASQRNIICIWIIHAATGWPVVMELSMPSVNWLWRREVTEIRTLQASLAADPKRNRRCTIPLDGRTKTRMARLRPNICQTN